MQVMQVMPVKPDMENTIIQATNLSYIPVTIQSAGFQWELK